jgi:hypothetical protein
MSFPTAPIDGEIATVNGIKYSYSSATNSWTRIAAGKFTAAAAASPPSNPALGDQWYNTNLDILFEYINDGTSSYWVDIISLGQASGNVSALVDSTLQGNVVVGINSIYSIGASNGYLNNLYANAITANAITVNGNIIPSANVTYNLGSTNYRFKDLFLSGNTIDLGGATIKTDATSGAIALIPLPTPSNPDPTGVVISATGAITTVTTTGGTVSGNAIGNATTGGSSIGANTSVINAQVWAQKIFWG